MQCEYCNKRHDGTFGTGRFCNGSCASSFSQTFITPEIQKQINKTLSKVMKGKIKNISPEARQRMRDGARQANLKREYKRKPLEELKWNCGTRKRIFEEKGRICEKCSWNVVHPIHKIPMTQVHHKDGNKQNNALENIEILCPNCHCLTDNYMNYGRTKNNPG